MLYHEECLMRSNKYPVRFHVLLPHTAFCHLMVENNILCHYLGFEQEAVHYTHFLQAASGGDGGHFGRGE